MVTNKGGSGFRFAACMCFGVCLLMTFCARRGLSQANIWAQAVPPEPEDTAPFRMIKVPEWVEQMTRVTYCFSVIDGAARSRAQAAGAEMSEMGFVSPYFANYESAILKRKDPNLKPDSIDREIADYKKRHVRILAVVPPGLQAEIYENHPEWRKVYGSTTDIPQEDLKKNPVGGPLCLLGPWGSRLVDILCEILKRYPDVDGFSFDGLHHAGMCRCQFCTANYRKDTGQDIPVSTSMNDPAFRRFVRWQDRKLEALIQEMQSRLKAIKPEVALVTWSTNAGRFGHLLDIPRNMSARTNLLLDAPDQEFWMDETNRGNTLMPAFANAVIWAASNHRVAFSSPYLFSHGNPYGADSFPAHEVLRRMLLAITYGARPSLALAVPDQMQGAIYEGIAEIKARSPWMVHTQPEHWAAILLSDNTRVFYGREPGRVEDVYLSNVLGAFRAVVEEHLPAEIVEDWNINPEDLSKYRVLILPNAACLSTTQCEAIRAYVKAGGGVVASMDSSLFDETGSPRNDFALSDLFGVHYTGTVNAKTGQEPDLDVNFVKNLDPSYWEKRKGIYSLQPSPSLLQSNPALKSLLGIQPVTFKGQLNGVTVAGGGVQSMADIAANEANPARPAIVQKRFGKGNVWYFAAGIDSASYLYAYPYQRMLLAGAIRAAASAPAPISVTAPMCVHTTVMRQQDPRGSRLVVHLFNDVNTTAGHAFPTDDVPLREETIPIHGIKLRFKSADSIKSIHLETGAKSLRINRLATGEAEVELPPLEIHYMVVAELK